MLLLELYINFVGCFNTTQMNAYYFHTFRFLLTTVVLVLRVSTVVNVKMESIFIGATVLWGTLTSNVKPVSDANIFLKIYRNQ